MYLESCRVLSYASLFQAIPLAVSQDSSDWSLKYLVDLSSLSGVCGSQEQGAKPILGWHWPWVQCPSSRGLCAMHMSNAELTLCLIDTALKPRSDLHLTACKYCKYASDVRSRLNRPRKEHDGIKAFSCTYNLSYLNERMRTHTQTIPGAGKGALYISHTEESAHYQNSTCVHKTR